MISALLCSCAKTEPAKPSASAKPSAEASVEVTAEEAVLDSSFSIVGRWSNEEVDVTTEFFKDGTYKTEQGGSELLSDTYTTEVVDSKTLLVKTGQGDSFEIVFIDEYTFESDGATMVRVTQNESIPENEDAGDYVAEELIIGIWGNDDGYMEFDTFGTLTVVEESSTGDLETSTFPYTVTTIDDTTIEITITDADGTTASETAYFEDSQTMVMGDTTFTREID